MDRRKYPRDWEAISQRIRARSGGRCEGPVGELAGRCCSIAGQPNPITGSVVVLTVAHLNHEPMDCRDENLRALCQRCHLNYDRPRHIAHAKARRHARRATGDLFSGLQG
jgi:5-methylcytosine-specific restriction endonuclease McrA